MGALWFTQIASGLKVFMIWNHFRWDGEDTFWHGLSMGGESDPLMNFCILCSIMSHIPLFMCKIHVPCHILIWCVKSDTSLFTCEQTNCNLCSQIENWRCLIEISLVRIWLNWELHCCRIIFMYMEENNLPPTTLPELGYITVTTPTMPNLRKTASCRALGCSILRRHNTHFCLSNWELGSSLFLLLFHQTQVRILSCSHQFR